MQILEKIKRSNVSNSQLSCLFVATRQKPCPQEVAELHQLFSDPQSVISSLINVMINIDPIHSPTVNLEQRLGGRLWRASVKFSWPVAFRVMGESTDRDRAQHYAYLEACKMFQNLGLLSSSGELLDWKSQLEKMFDSVLSKLKLKSSFWFSSHQEITAKKPMWNSSLEVRCPLYLTVVGRGVTKCSAENAAAALALVKLKSMKYLDKTNTSLSSLHEVHLFLKPPTKNFIWVDASSVNFTPDYEIWVDASKLGFGAYLVSNIDISKTERTRWLREIWPNEIRDAYVIPKHFSSLTEFYALVCAVYTWKKKFQGRSVLIWSDSSHAVSLVNQGLLIDLNVGQGHKHLKLFKILQDTCLQYSIDLRSRHIKRVHNQAADSLSKLKMEEFFSMVPNASLKAKKSKKLLFILPLFDLSQTIRKSWTTNWEHHLQQQRYTL